MKISIGIGIGIGIGIVERMFETPSALTSKPR